MNNIMINEHLCRTLIEASIDHFNFGRDPSDGGRDLDRVFILPNFPWWLNAPVNTHHWLHFKGKDDHGMSVDYLFTTLSDFYRAVVNGDSHIPIEVLFKNRGDLGGTCLEFLTGQYSEYFGTYKVLRSYLGLARKDIKQAREFLIKGNNTKVNKKIRMIIEGLYRVAKAIKVDFDYPKTMDRTHLLNYLQTEHDKMRLEINLRKESGNIDVIYPDYLADFIVVGAFVNSSSVSIGSSFEIIRLFAANEGV